MSKQKREKVLKELKTIFSLAARLKEDHEIKITTKLASKLEKADDELIAIHILAQKLEKVDIELLAHETSSNTAPVRDKQTRSRLLCLESTKYDSMNEIMNSISSLEI